MQVGNDVIIRVDALPEPVVESTLTGISPIAEFSLDTFNSSFHVHSDLEENADSRLRPGMNGGMDVVIERIPEAIAIPARALFTRGGKPAVYLVENDTYRLVEVEVLARNPDEVAISGIPGDSRVALADPEVGADPSTGEESE
jgi:multidrug efflux pump subunit AcrA (membrane-fusion protein)